MQATIRCIAGAALLSAVVGGIAYGSAEQHFQTKERELQDLAFRACIDLGPPSTDKLQRDPAGLQAQLDLCNYAHGAVERGRHG
jgi:hypothetical protein